MQRRALDIIRPSSGVSLRSGVRGQGATLTSFLPHARFLGGMNLELSAQTAKTALERGKFRVFPTQFTGGAERPRAWRPMSRQVQAHSDTWPPPPSTCCDMQAHAGPSHLSQRVGLKNRNCNTRIKVCTEYANVSRAGLLSCHDVIHVRPPATNSDFVMLLISCQCRGCQRPFTGAVVRRRPSALVCHLFW